jgi:hypothetical protein
MFRNEVRFSCIFMSAQPRQDRFPISVVPLCTMRGANPAVNYVEFTYWRCPNLTKRKN